MFWKQNKARQQTPNPLWSCVHSSCHHFSSLSLNFSKKKKIICIHHPSKASMFSETILKKRSPMTSKWTTSFAHYSSPLQCSILNSTLWASYLDSSPSALSPFDFFTGFYSAHCGHASQSGVGPLFSLCFQILAVYEMFFLSQQIKASFSLICRHFQILLNFQILLKKLYFIKLQNVSIIFEPSLSLLSDNY